MNPCKPFPNLPCRGLTDTVAFGEKCQGFLTTPDIPDSGISEFRVVTSFAAFQSFWFGPRSVQMSPCVPFLEVSIPSVVRWSTYKEMRWPDTKANVAFMKDAQSGRNCAVDKKPREPVRTDIVMPRIEAELPVSIRIFGSVPDPAFVVNRNVFPETWEGVESLSSCKLMDSHVAPPMRVVRDRKGPRIPSGPGYFSTEH